MIRPWLGGGGWCCPEKEETPLANGGTVHDGGEWGVEERWALEQENWGPACEDGPALRDITSAQFPPVEWGSLANSQLPG